MKVLLATLALFALVTPVLLAQDAAPAGNEQAAETTPAADAAALAPAEEAPAPAPVPPVASEGATPDLTPAREEPLPVPAPSMDLMPSADPGTPQVLPEPVLIPETPPEVEKSEGAAIEQSQKIKPSKTEAAADALAQKIRYRRVKTRALGDPAVQAEWQKAQTAHTDYEKREALKRYYKLLYGRMEKIDKSLRKQIAERQQNSLRRLQQHRIEPTHPLTAEETELRARSRSGSM